MNRLSRLLIIVAVVALWGSSIYAQRGGGGGGFDTTALHRLDSLLRLHHGHDSLPPDTLPPPPPDSLPNRHHGFDTLNRGGDTIFFHRLDSLIKLRRPDSLPPDTVNRGGNGHDSLGRRGTDTTLLHRLDSLIKLRRHDSLPDDSLPQHRRDTLNRRGGDTTFFHRLDSLIRLRRNDSLPQHHRGDTINRGGFDTTLIHRFDSLIKLRRHDSLPPPPPDTINPGGGGKDTTNTGGGGGGKDTTTTGGGGGKDTTNTGGGGGKDTSTVQINVNKILSSDSCLLMLEGLMSPSDAAALAAALAQEQADQNELLLLGNELRIKLSGLGPGDTAEANAIILANQARQQQLMQDEQNQQNLITKLLANYGPQLLDVWQNCGNQPPPPPPPPGGGTGGKSIIIQMQPPYPNPVSTSSAQEVNVEYSISADAAVSLTVSDVTGTTIQQFNLQEAAGNYSQHISVAGLNAGVYYVRVQAGNTVQTSKILIMK